MTKRRERGRPPHFAILTRAEWRVVEAVRHGMTNPQIATRMRVSVNAMKYHVTNALTKLGFTSRAELRRWDGVNRESNLHAKKDKAVNVQLGSVGQIARTVNDIAAARSW